jgi:hypothetical protein
VWRRQTTAPPRTASARCCSPRRTRGAPRLVISHGKPQIVPGLAAEDPEPSYSRRAREGCGIPAHSVRTEGTLGAAAEAPTLSRAEGVRFRRGDRRVPGHDPKGVGITRLARAVNPGPRAAVVARSRSPKHACSLRRQAERSLRPLVRTSAGPGNIVRFGRFWRDVHFRAVTVDFSHDR